MGILTKGEYTVTNLEDGRGISKAESTYQKSTSGTVVPTGTWTTNIPSVGAGEYLWTRTLFTYTDNTTSSTYTVGRMGTNGNNGLGISNNSVHYQASSSGTTAPTGTWTATIPTVAANEYLWTRTTLTYTNATTSVSYSVGKMGADGKDAQLLYLTASSQIQAFDKDDRPKTTQAITISAKLQNTSGVATFVAIPYIGNIAQTPITLGGTGNDRTLLPSQWTNTQWATIAITATLGSLTDTISVVRVKDGDTGATGKDGVAGKDGVGLVSTQVMYAGSDSGTVKPTTGWTAAVPTLAAGKYLWTETTWLYSDNTGEAGYSVSRIGKDGNTGKDGIAGKDGVGISNTVIEYVGAVSGTSKPTSGWSTAIPTVPQGQYLWTRTTWTYTDGTKEQGYSAALMGPKGDKGDTGDDGQTPVVHPAWSWSADGTDRFTTVYPGDNIYKSVAPFTWTGGDGWTHTGNHIGSEIAKGGKITISFDVDSSVVQTANMQFQIITHTAGGTRIEALNAPISATELNAKKRVYKHLTLKADPTIAFAQLHALPSSLVAGSKTTLKNIKVIFGDIENVYTPAPSEDYANAYPLYEGTYTDYSETASQNPADYTWRRIIGESGQDGVAGADGKGIKSTAVSYQASTSGTVAPTGTWVANPPTVTKGQYLWTRTIWTYTDSTTETGYSVAYVAKDGNDGSDGVAGKDGVGIKSTAITYAVSSSGTTAPTSGWVASPPTATAGQFMWTRTVWTYTDNTTETGYSVGKIGNNGANGSDGKDGDDGKDGVGIASTAVTYQASANGTTAPTGTWSTTIPSVAENQYLWTRVVLTFTDNTTATFHSVGKMGAKGSNGTNSYFHTAWADSSDGRTGFSTTVSLGKKYIGTYADNTQAGSTDPTKYKWVELANAIDLHTAYKMADETFSKEKPDGNELDPIIGVGSAETQWYMSANTGVTVTSGVDDGTLWLTDTVSTSYANWKQWQLQTGPSTHNPYLWDRISKNLGTSIAMSAKITVSNNTVVSPDATGIIQMSLRDSKGVNVIRKIILASELSATPTEFIASGTLPESLDGLTNYRLIFSFHGNSTARFSDIKFYFEDWAIAIPKYVGTSTKDSDNPDDYTWTLNPEWVQMSSDKGLEDKLGNDQYLDDKGEIWTEIGNKVSQEEANEIRDMASSVESSLSAFLDDGGQYETDLESLEARTQGLVQALGDQLATYEFLKTYISMGEEGLVIGSHDSTLKVLLSNGQLSFIDGGQTVAYFASQKFYINSGAVVESLQIGYHKIASLDKNNTVWQWIQG